MRSPTGKGSGATRPPHRFGVVAGTLILSLVTALLPLGASPALATQAATASVDRTISYRGQTYTYTFTVTNSSTAGETIPSVQVGRPNLNWTISGCQAPAGWTATVTGATHCTFNSATGTPDDIAPGASRTFRVTGTVAAGNVTEENLAWWTVATDSTDNFDAANGSTAATGAGNALIANIYGIEITDIVVQTVASPIGSPCPTSFKKAPAGSARELAVCGRVYTVSNFMAKSLNSELWGTFVQRQGNLLGTAVVPSPNNVVLAIFPSVAITSTVGTGLTVEAYIGNAPDKMSSPWVSLTGYTTDTTPPLAPSAPDLVAASDSGASSSDDITNVTTPTFSGSAEAGSTVEILIAGTVRATTLAAADGSYSATVPGGSPLAEGGHSVTARATDPSNNVGPESAPLAIRVDTTAPDDPAIGTRPGAWGSDSTPTWAFSTEPGAHVVCKIDYPDATRTSDNSCVSPKTFDISAGEDGPYRFRVSQTDIAGNASGENTDNYLLDRAPPIAPTITTRPPETTANSSVGWAFAGETSATFECVLIRPDLTEAVDGSCTSPKSFNLNTRPDGLYTFKVRQFDRAGQASPYASDTFTLDRQAPLAPMITAEPPARTNDATPEWDFIGEGGGSYECVVTTPGGAELSDVNCTPPKTYDLTTDDDGLYQFKVRETDAAGNAGPYATSSFTLDRQAPLAPSITSRPASVTDHEDPAWTFTGEFGASYECLLVRPDGSEIGSAPCASGISFPLDAEQDGDYTFKVRQIDVAGNAGPYALDEFTLDREGPAAPMIDSRPADHVNDPAVAWEFSGETNATFECVLERPDRSEIIDASCSAPKTFDLDAEDDGTYTFKVRQTDLAGHQSSYATDTFTIDRSAPAAPVITTAPLPRTNDATPTWAFAGEENASYECVLVRPGGAQESSPGCSGAQGYDLSAEIDGIYTFKVRQFDQAGNPGPYASSSYTLDRQAPTAPTIGTAPGNVTNDEEPVWTFTGEFGASYECALVRSDGSEIDSSPCASPTSFNLTSEEDGDYTFKVRQIDSAGNPGPYATEDFTLDRVAPDPPTITSRPANFINDEAPAWIFTGDGDPPFECVLVRPDDSVIERQPCSAPASFDLSGESDGTYTFQVRQLDDAGNKSLYTTDTFTLDRQAPVAPTITAAPPAKTNDDTPEWTFTGELGGSYECVLVRPDGSETAPQACSSTKTFDLTSATDGAYTFKVRQIDAAGNVGPYATNSFTLDRAAPAAAAITSGPADHTTGEAPEWTFTGEFGASFECILVRPDNSQVSSIPCTAPASFDLSSEPDGDYIFKVRQIDAAGNPGPYETDTFTLDRQAPAAPTIDSRPGDEIKGAAARWGFSGEANATFECVLVKPDLTEVNDPSCVSPKTIDLTADQDGVYTFKVRQTDEAGLSSEYAVDTFTLDRQAPAAPTITAGPPANTNDETPEWEFTGEPGGSYECVLVRPDDSEVGPAPCSSPATFSLETEQDGAFTFKVRQSDDAGNIGLYGTWSFTLDRQRPQGPMFTSLPPNRTANNSPQWSFTGEDGAVFECLLTRPDGSAIDSIPCSSPKNFDLTAEQDGAYEFKVRQIDTAGNAGGYSTDSFTLDREAPASLAILSEPPPYSPNATPEWTFEGEAGGTYECVLVRPTGAQLSDPTCSAPKSYDLSGDVDGLYTFKVRQTDTAYNRGDYVTSSFTLDRQAPDAPAITDRPADLTTDEDPEWTFTGETGAIYECELVLPDGSQIEPATCSSPATFPLGAEEDGAYTFKVRQIDQAGNIGVRSMDSFTLDRLAPNTPTITASPPLDTSDSTPRWEFSGEVGGSYECVLVKPGDVIVTTPDCSSAVEYDLASDEDGTYDFMVRQFDDVANVSGYAMSSFTLDRAAPLAPTVTATPEYFYDTTPEWGFTGEDGGTFECMLVRPDSTEIVADPCTSPANFDLSGEPDGTYTFKVRQVDAAGNSGGYGSHDHHFDKTPPTPTLTGGAPSLTNDSTHETTITGEPEAVFECKLTYPGGTTTVDAECSSPYAMDLTNDPDGSYTLSVRQFIGENPSLAAAQTFTLDRTVARPSLSVQPGAAGADPSPEWLFEGEEGAVFQCVLAYPDGSEVSDDDCLSPQRPSLTDHPDGDYVLKVRQIDAAGNVSGFASKKYSLDRRAPEKPAITSKPKRRIRDLTPTWSFSGEAGAGFDCSLEAPNGTVSRETDCGSTKTYGLNRIEGRYVLTVVQRDRAGNVSTASISRFNLDLTKPAAKRLRVAPKRFVATKRTSVGIRFGRSEPAVAWVLIKKGRKTLRTFKKPMGRTRVELKWRTVYRKRVIKPGKYKVVVKLKDKVGWRTKSAVTIRARG